MERSATGVTVVGCDGVMLVASGSVTLPETVAELVTDGAASAATATVRVMVELAPEARPAALVRVTRWPTAGQVQPVPVPDTTASPDGSAFSHTTLFRSDGPALPTVRV